jgi:transcriptional regulator with XRE-family HTH domain
MTAPREHATAGKRPRRNFTEAELAYAAAVGQRIYEQRKKLKLSTEALAHRAGVVSITQYRREKGLMMVTTPDLHRYAVIFGCQPGDLLPPIPNKRS